VQFLHFVARSQNGVSNIKDTTYRTFCRSIAKWRLQYMYKRHRDLPDILSQYREVASPIHVQETKGLTGHFVAVSRNGVSNTRGTGTYRTFCRSIAKWRLQYKRHRDLPDILSQYSEMASPIHVQETKGLTGHFVAVSRNGVSNTRGTRTHRTPSVK
jgi:hypothetical protein